MSTTAVQTQIRACDRCHRRKTRCDKGQPCVPCRQAGSACTYSDRVKEVVYSQSFVQQLQRRIRQLETRNETLQSATGSGHEPPTYDKDTGQHEERFAAAKEVAFLSTSATGDRLFLGPTSGILLAGLVKAGVTYETLPNLSASIVSQADETAWSIGFAGDGIRDDLTLPSRDIANRLVDAYLLHDHLLYPFLHPDVIRAAVEYTYNGTDPDPSPSESHAFNAFTCNMILAITLSQSYRRHWQPVADARFHYQQALRYLNTIICEGGTKVLQSMLLLCQLQLASSGRDASNSLWHIVGILARVCFELGLHREGTYQAGPSIGRADIPLHSPPYFGDHDIRRLCFWCVFALDRIVSITLGRPLAIHGGDITVEMPNDHTAIVTALQPSSIPPPTQDDLAIAPNQQIALFRHIIHYRDICGRSLTMLHRSGRDILSISHHFQIRHTLMAELESWRMNTKNLNLLDMDLTTPLVEARSSYRCVAWYELLYNNGILLLYRPSYATVSNVADGDNSNNHIFCAAKEVIVLSSYLFRSRKINFSLMLLHTVFLAGLSYIYALSRYLRERRQQQISTSVALSTCFRLLRTPTLIDIVNNCRACSNVLVAVSERCNSLENCYEVFNRLSDVVVNDAMEVLSGHAVDPDQRSVDKAPTGPSGDINQLDAKAMSKENIPNDYFEELQSMYERQWSDNIMLQLGTELGDEPFDWGALV